MSQFRIPYFGFETNQTINKPLKNTKLQLHLVLTKIGQSNSCIQMKSRLLTIYVITITCTQNNPMSWGKPQELQTKYQLRSPGLQYSSRSLILSPRSRILHNAKDSNQIVQVSLKHFLGFMLIITCLEKEKKGSSEKSRDNQDINA